MEKFIEIKGFEGLYEVSNLGNVKSLNYNHTGKEKNMSFGKHSQGYLTVNLWKDKKRKTFLVHVLVWDSFIGLTKGKEINHKKGIKHDNRLSELEELTHSENVKHSYNTKLKKPSYGNSKISFKIAEEIRLKRKKGYSNKELCIEYNLSSSRISAICNNRNWIKQREL